jgi:hypothetical protein
VAAREEGLHAAFFVLCVTVRVMGLLALSRGRFEVLLQETLNVLDAE